MSNQFAAIAFTDAVREVQQEMGSRAAYADFDSGVARNHRLGENEIAFLQMRDSFYMASVGETGWPYVQHRGGAPGFVRVLDDRTIGFADYRGNRQYVSVGNLRGNDRVSLFFMDYPNQARLKMLGRARVIGSDDAQMALLQDDHRVPAERGIVIDVEAFDWNCPQHITPRYTEKQIERLIAPLAEEVRTLRATRTDATATPMVVGDGPRKLVISGLRQLTPRVRAYELRDPLGASLPSVGAGTHIPVPVRLADGRNVVRDFSIASDPNRSDHWEIAVLREDGGSGTSAALHDTFGLGVQLHAGEPRNNFPLHEDERPALLIAGGIGITPIRAMAHALDARGNEFSLHYAARSRTDLAYEGELRQLLGKRMSTYVSAQNERLDLAEILRTAGDETMIYVCGPERLLEAATHVAAELDMHPDRLRSETF